MKNNKLANCLAISSWLGVFLLPASLPAQEASLAKSGLNDALLTRPIIDEVVVTARKRSESILAVPVVITALSQEQLERFAIDDIHAVASRVPGLNIGTGQGSFGAQVSMRGIGTNTLSASIDQSISLNIDGLQMTQGLAFNTGMFDVDQIEVLKGPQALFFGKNSPGGVISLRSADPGDEAEIMVRAGYELEAKDKRVELILSGPVSDTVGLRLAAAFSDSEGYFRNKARPSELNGGVPGGLDPKYRRLAAEDDVIVRATTLWEPSDRFQARLKVNHNDYERQGDGGQVQYKHCPDGLDSISGIPFGAGEDCRLDKRFAIADLDPELFPGVPNRGVPYLERVQTFGTLELSYQPTSDLDFTSVTGFYDLDSNLLINPTSSPGVPAIALDGGLARQDFTQELRLSSAYTGPLNFLVGAYYQKSEIVDSSVLIVNNTFVGPESFPPRLIDSIHTIDIEAHSLFGQVLWNATPSVEVSLGARWTDERRSQRTFVNAEFTTDTVFIPGINAPAYVELDVPRLSSSNISPELTLSYRPSESLTVFGALKKGFKSGSFSSIGATTTDQSYGDEEIQGGEVGLKTRLLDQRLNLNAAAYYYLYDDMQVGAFENTGAAFLMRTINAASAEIKGIEVDFDYMVSSIPGFSVRGALNYNHARFDEFDNAPCYVGQTVAMGCARNINPATGLYTAQDLSGKKLLRSPDWTALLGFDYERTLPGGSLLTVGATFNYTASYQTSLAMVSSTRQDAHVKTSASIAVRAPGGSWEMALIGNNLSDRVTSGNCTIANLANGTIFGGNVDGGTHSGLSGVGETACWPDRGREVHLRLTFWPLAWR